ncbi:fibronectin type III domain-containing protein [Sorangium sp. So ce726]|uniref:fibronectin type III domain-containing protein n=1 Tax=Sorangium sp. So ce726 TaxID=3133319 RepID=UPI003F6341F1
MKPSYLLRNHVVLGFLSVLAGMLLTSSGVRRAAADPAPSGTWVYVGAERFTTGIGGALLRGDGGKLYLLSQRDLGTGAAPSRRPFVHRFDGSWTELPPITSRRLSGNSLTDFNAMAFDVEHDTPYVACCDIGATNADTVTSLKKLNELNEWSPVGEPFRAGLASGLRLDVDNGVPYVSFVFNPANATGSPSGSNSKLVVMKYTEGSWLDLGSPPAKTDIPPDSHALYVRQGVPYVAFRDSGDGNRLKVMRYGESGEGWVQVGPAGSAVPSSNVQVTLAFEGEVLYAGYKSSGTTAEVARLEASDAPAWMPLGDLSASIPGTAAFSLKHFSLNHGVPRVWVSRTGTAELAKQYAGGGWEDLFDTSSLKETGKINRSLTFLDGKPYVVRTSSEGSSVLTYATVDFSLGGMAKDGKVTLRWSSVEGAAGYLLYMSERSPVPLTTISRVFNATETSGDVGGLVNGTSYRFVMKTLDGRISNEYQLTPQALPPTAPTGLRAVATDGGKVLLQWAPVTDDTGANATGYEIYVRQPDGSYAATPDWIVAGTLVTQVEVSDLESGVLQYFRVKAINANGASDFSDEASATPAMAVWKRMPEPLNQAGRGSSLVVHDGTPYLAFSDVNPADGQRSLTVMEYVGSDWRPLGARHLAAVSGVANLSLAVDGGALYVAFADPDEHLAVMKYTRKGATGWETVGKVGVSDATEISLSVSGGIPYVACNRGSEGFIGTEDWLQAGAVVLKYDPGVSAWELLGPGVVSLGWAGDYVSLQVADGVPYVTFRDEGSSLDGSVLRYDGADWEPLEERGFTGRYSEAGVTKWTSLAVYEGVPYLAFRGRGANVMRFNGARWEHLGSPEFYVASHPSGALADLGNLRLAIDQGVPYVLFNDGSKGERAVAMKYTGKGDTGWDLVGNPAFSSDVARHNALAAFDGVVYAAFSESDRTTVMRFDDSGRAPAVPLTVSATAGNGEAAVSWNAVPKAAAYRVYAGTEPGVYGAPVHVVEAKYEAGELVNGQTYYFAVSAVNENGESGHSRAVAVTPMDRTAPLLSDVSAVPGSRVGTTVVQVVLEGDESLHLALHVSPTDIATPEMGASPPPGLHNPYAGEDVAVSVGDYLGVYLVNAHEEIQAFAKLALSREQIRQPEPPGEDEGSGGSGAGADAGVGGAGGDPGQGGGAQGGGGGSSGQGGGAQGGGAQGGGAQGGGGGSSGQGGDAQGGGGGSSGGPGVGGASSTDEGGSTRAGGGCSCTIPGSAEKAPGSLLGLGVLVSGVARLRRKHAKRP